MNRRLASAALSVVLAGCGAVSQAGQPTVVLDEFSVETAGVVAAGRTEMVVRNEGEFGHTLVVTDEAGEVVMATDLIEPGDEVSVTGDLDSGIYQFSCRIVVETPDGSISDHFEQGMVEELEVAGG